MLYLTLLAILCENRTAIEHKTIGRHFVVQLETLLGGRDGGQDRQPAAFSRVTLPLSPYKPQAAGQIGRRHRQADTLMGRWGGVKARGTLSPSGSNGGVLGERRGRMGGSYLLTRDLMLDAVPYSSPSILLTRAIISLGGMMSEIMDVPLLLAHAQHKITVSCPHPSVQAHSPFPRIPRSRA